MQYVDPSFSGMVYQALLIAGAAALVLWSGLWSALIRLARRLATRLSRPRR